MSTYLAGPSSPALLREYDKKKAETATAEDAPKQRPSETSSEFEERVRKFQIVAAAMNRL